MSIATDALLKTTVARVAALEKLCAELKKQADGLAARPVAQPVLTLPRKRSDPQEQG